MKAEGRAVAAYDGDGKLVGEYRSLAEAAKRTFVDSSAIRRCANCREYGRLCGACLQMRRFGLAFRDWGRK